MPYNCRDAVDAHSPSEQHDPRPLGNLELQRAPRNRAGETLRLIEA